MFSSKNLQAVFIVILKSFLSQIFVFFLKTSFNFSFTNFLSFFTDFLTSKLPFTPSFDSTFREHEPSFFRVVYVFTISSYKQRKAIVLKISEKQEAKERKLHWFAFKSVVGNKLIEKKKTVWSHKKKRLKSLCDIQAIIQNSFESFDKLSSVSKTTIFFLVFLFEASSLLFHLNEIIFLNLWLSSNVLSEVVNNKVDFCRWKINIIGGD